MRGSFNQLRLLKEAHPHLKTLISVGGWTLSNKFPQVAATQQGRDNFAASCVEFMQTYGFDGIDIDWEYPVSGGLTDGTPADRENFTLLLADLREALDEVGEGYLLTIAAPAGPSTYANIELEAIHPYLDFINVMTYDFHGGWETQTGHNAPMHPASGDPFANAATYNVHSAIQAYLDAGIPSNKVVMGLPFYGRGWQGVTTADDGRFQSATDPAANGTWEAGIFDYKDLKNHFLGQGYTRYWDAEALVPWLYNAATGIWISYDDPESLAIKSDYIVAEELGGAMYWELSSDTADAELLSVVYETLAE
jgi:chitinase